MKTFVPGFWILSIAIALSFSIPCYAQVETEGFVTPERTLWKIMKDCPNLNAFTTLGIFNNTIWLCDDIGSGCVNFPGSGYTNGMIYHLYYGICGEDFCSGFTGYVMPLIGLGKIKYRDMPCTSLLIKVGNNFIPSP